MSLVLSRIPAPVIHGLCREKKIPFAVTAHQLYTTPFNIQALIYFPPYCAADSSVPTVRCYVLSLLCPRVIGRSRTDLFGCQVLHAPGHLVGEAGQLSDGGRLVVERPLVAGGGPTLT